MGTETESAIVVTSFERLYKRYFEIHFPEGSVFEKIGGQTGEICVAGIGEYVRTSGSDAESGAFLGLFVIHQRIYLIANGLHEITDDSTLRIVRPLSGFFLPERTIQFFRSGEMAGEISYRKSGRDLWEHDDGDVGWWIESQIKSQISRAEFLTAWPKIHLAR